jgi:hypothetical protein
LDFWKEAKNCWKYWSCSEEFKDKCPTYAADQGRNYWKYTGDLSPFEWARSKRNFDSCLECPWYKKMHS